MINVEYALLKDTENQGGGTKKFNNKRSKRIKHLELPLSEISSQKTKSFLLSFINIARKGNSSFLISSMMISNVDSAILQL